MAQIDSYGEIEADGSIVNDNNSGDFTVTKTGATFRIAFGQNVSKSIFVATAKTTSNRDPSMVAIVERGDDSRTLEVTLLQASNGSPRNDRGFWFMAVNDRFEVEKQRYQS